MGYILLGAGVLCGMVSFMLPTGSRLAWRFAIATAICGVLGIALVVL